MKKMMMVSLFSAVAVGAAVSPAMAYPGMSGPSPHGHGSSHGAHKYHTSSASYTTPTSIAPISTAPISTPSISIPVSSTVNLDGCLVGSVVCTTAAPATVTLGCYSSVCGSTSQHVSQITVDGVLSTRIQDIANRVVGKVASVYVMDHQGRISKKMGEYAFNGAASIARHLGKLLPEVVAGAKLVDAQGRQVYDRKIVIQTSDIQIELKLTDKDIMDWKQL